MAYVKLDKEFASAVKNTLTEINEEISLCCSSVSSSFNNKKVSLSSPDLYVYDEEGELIADYTSNARTHNSAAENGRNRAILIRDSVTAKVNKVITALDKVISLVDNFENQTGISLESELGSDLSSAFQFLASYGDASSLSALRGNGFFGNSSLNGIYSFDSSLLEYDELGIWSSFGGFLEEHEGEGEIENSIREFFVGKLQGYMDENGNIVVDGVELGSLNSLSMATLLQTDAGQQMKAEFENEYKDQISMLLFGGGTTEPGMVPFGTDESTMATASAGAIALTSALTQLNKTQTNTGTVVGQTSDEKKKEESTVAVNTITQYVEKYGDLVEGEDFEALAEIIAGNDGQMTDADLAAAISEAGIDIDAIVEEVSLMTEPEGGDGEAGGDTGADQVESDEAGGTEGGYEELTGDESTSDSEVEQLLEDDEQTSDESTGADVSDESTAIDEEKDIHTKPEGENEGDEVITEESTSEQTGEGEGYETSDESTGEGEGYETSDESTGDGEGYETSDESTGDGDETTDPTSKGEANDAFKAEGDGKGERPGGPTTGEDEDLHTWEEEGAEQETGDGEGYETSDESTGEGEGYETSDESTGDGEGYETSDESTGDGEGYETSDESTGDGDETTDPTSKAEGDGKGERPGGPTTGEDEDLHTWEEEGAEQETGDGEGYETSDESTGDGEGYETSEESTGDGEETTDPTSKGEANDAFKAEGDGNGERPGGPTTGEHEDLHMREESHEEKFGEGEDEAAALGAAAAQGAGSVIAGAAGKDVESLIEEMAGATTTEETDYASSEEEVVVDAAPPSNASNTGGNNNQQQASTPSISGDKTIEKPGLGMVNIDDGKTDTNIDTNGDGKPSLNITFDEPEKPDVNLDTNGDGKADLNIGKNEGKVTEPSKPSIKDILPDIPKIEDKVDEIVNGNQATETEFVEEKKIGKNAAIAGAAAATTTVIGNNTPAPNVQVSAPVLSSGMTPSASDVNLSPMISANQPSTNFQVPGNAPSHVTPSTAPSAPAPSTSVSSSQSSISAGSSSTTNAPSQSVDASRGEISGKSYNTAPSDSTTSKSSSSNSSSSSSSSSESRSGTQRSDIETFDKKMDINASEGVLGDSSYAEMIVKNEKEVKIATGISVGSMAFALALKLTNVIGIISFVLVVGAIVLVYTTFRVKKNNERKKIESIISIKKVETDKEEKDTSDGENVIYEEEIVYVDEEGNVIELPEDAKIVNEEIVTNDDESNEKKEFQSAEEVIYGDLPKKKSE